MDWWRMTAALYALGTATAAPAQTLDEAAAKFAARETVLYSSLSPSGTKLAVITPFGQHGEALLVYDLASTEMKPVNVLQNDDIQADIDYCDWASEARLVCGLYLNIEGVGIRLGFTRLVAIGADGSNLKQLTRGLGDRALGINQDGGSILALDVAGQPDTILMTREFVPEITIGTRLANVREGLGVVEVNIDDLRARLVEQPKDNATSYIADDNGRVRIMVRQPADNVGNLGDREITYYRSRTSDSWERLSEVQIGAQSSAGFRPVAVDSARDVVFGFAESDGYSALYSIALDGSGKREQLLARGDVDVDRLIRIGRRNRVVGASYATEKREVLTLIPSWLGWPPPSAGPCRVHP